MSLPTSQSGPDDFFPVPIKVNDKRGQKASQPAAPASPPPAEGEGHGDGEGSDTPSPSAEQMAEVLKQIDFLRQGDKFWVRDVQYAVIDELPSRNAVVISPAQIGRETRKKMKKVGRSR